MRTFHPTEMKLLACGAARRHVQVVEKLIGVTTVACLLALRTVRSLAKKSCDTRLWALPKPTNRFHPLEN